MKKGKEWLKEKVNKILRDNVSVGINYYDYMNLKNSFNELIDQLDEPEKVVIPQFVAGWIEQAKNLNGDPVNAIWEMYEDETYPIYSWVTEDNNSEALMQAMVNGYEVYEPLYYAMIKGARLTESDRVYWNANNTGQIIISDNTHNEIFRTKLTLSEWNDLGVNEDNTDFEEVDHE